MRFLDYILHTYFVGTVMRKTILFTYFLLSATLGFSQNDSSANKIDSFLLHQKGLLGKISRNLVANQALPSTTPIRNDLLFNKYRGKVIRNIIVVRLDFGTSLTDTAKRFNNTLTHLANTFHHKTREKVIRNNLFLKRVTDSCPI